VSQSVTTAVFVENVVKSMIGSKNVPVELRCLFATPVVCARLFYRYSIGIGEREQNAHCHLHIIEISQLAHSSESSPYAPAHILAGLAAIGQLWCRALQIFLCFYPLIAAFSLQSDK